MNIPRQTIRHGATFMGIPDDPYRVPEQYRPLLPPRLTSDAIVICNWCQGETRLHLPLQHQLVREQIDHSQGRTIHPPSICCVLCYDRMRAEMTSDPRVDIAHIFNPFAVTADDFA